MKNLFSIILFLAGLQLHAQSQQFTNKLLAAHPVLAKAVAKTQGSNNDKPYRWTYYMYDTISHSYIFKERQLYTYDNNGNTIQIVIQANKNDSAADSLRYIFTYSPDGLEFTQLTQSFDNNWVNIRKDTFNLDTHGNETYNATYNWINGSWQAGPTAEKMQYIYDKDGHMITYTFFTQSNPSSPWRFNEKDSCVLDANGKVKQKLVYASDSKGNPAIYQDYFYLVLLNNDINHPLFDSVKYISTNGSTAIATDSFAYTPDGKMTLHLQKRVINGTWTKTEEESCIYNTHHDRISYIAEGRNRLGIFDTSFVSTDSLLYDDQDRLIVAFTSAAMNGSPLNRLSKGTWDYKKDGLAENSQQINLFTAYPNPLKDILNIRCNSTASAQTKITLYDMQGRKVWSVLTSDKVTQISVAAFPSGVYELRAESANQLQCIKVVKY
jgi:hypothetical protein